MDRNRILVYFILLLAGIGLGYLFGRSGTTEPSASVVTETTAVRVKTDENAAEDSSLPEQGASDSLSTVAEEAATNDTPEENPPIETTSDQTADRNSLPSPDLCFKEDSDELRMALLNYTQKLERDSLWYNNREPEKLLDCSGIFHRISKFVSTKCDAYKYPDVRTTRDTRALAGWFYDNDNLVIVHDAAKQRNLIKPGTVMFFGKSGQWYNELTIDRLKQPIPNHVIMHVGVVTDIKQDEEGNVLNYTMFHGRRPGKIASSTYYHDLEPPRAGFPPLGNWNQQLVAVASIMTPQ